MRFYVDGNHGILMQNNVYLLECMFHVWVSVNKSNLTEKRKINCIECFCQQFQV